MIQYDEEIEVWNICTTKNMVNLISLIDEDYDFQWEKVRVPAFVETKMSTFYNCFNFCSLIYINF